MKLTRVERWMLSNQYRILEKLYPEEAESLAVHREALENGYERDYSRIAENIYDDKYTLTTAECDEVIDVLSMHRALKYAYDALADRSGIEAWQIEFSGFDGNNEPTLLGYTRWFCNQEGGRFTELTRGDDFNSHMPSLGRYRAMLKEWNASKDRNKLTKEDIVRIGSVRA